MTHPEPSPEQTEALIADFRLRFEQMRSALSAVIAGQDQLLHDLLVAAFAGGHVLLEGAPGLGKTLLVRTLAGLLKVEFARVQFTPDLMPTDIIGTNILRETVGGDRTMEFQPGPLFTNILLADEINRATPKTQSALLESMQEHQVTVGRTQHRLSEPFLVIATQNPIEMEGTYPLPEAQLDRFFFKLLVPFPTSEQLHTIADRTTGALTPPIAPITDGGTLVTARALLRGIPIARPIQDAAVRVLLATHPGHPESDDFIRTHVRYGASPRGLQAMILAAKIEAVLAGRLHVSLTDLAKVAPPALRHRILLNFEGETSGLTTDEVVARLSSRFLA